MTIQYGPRERGWKLAAPSFVYPAHVAENWRRLAPLVNEVALTLFEWEACLAYTRDDLPASLTRLGPTCHAHLPLDLPWNEGPERVLDILSALTEKIAHLEPTALVLHPPPPATRRSWPDWPHAVADRLGRCGFRPESILAENIRECDLTREWDAITAAGLGVCLDIGHVLAYAQDSLPRLPGFWDRVRMVHAYAPGEATRHARLGLLDRPGRELLALALERLQPGGTLVVEVFSEAELLGSLRDLEAFLDRRERGA